MYVMANRDVDVEEEDEGIVVFRGDSRAKRLTLQETLPYLCESLDTADQFFEAVIRRVLDCIPSNDFDVGLVQWTSRLQGVLALKYPIRRDLRVQLARLYFDLAVMETLDVSLVELAASICITLIRPKSEISHDDLELPWEPLHAALVRVVYHKQRRVGHGGAGSPSGALLDLAEYAQRFFAPDAADAMLAAMLPRMSGSDINSVVIAEAFVVHFLPLAYPERWLPAMFRVWETFRSSLFDEQMLDHLSRLSEYHMSESQSGARRNSIGIFTEAEYARIMSKCLRSAGLPVGTNKAAGAALVAQSASVRTGADAIATGKTLRVKKPSDMLRSYAVINVYSMTDDGDKTLVGHSRALDLLVKYVQATESYFHPSNWGIWQAHLVSFVQHLTWAFMRRLRAEEREECRTPAERRLTPLIRREFVRVLRSVCLLSMFSRDPMTTTASQVSLKRLACLQPELVIPQVLQRSFPSLEALETTQRTTAVLSTLSALVQPMTHRTLYPAGAKHIVPLLYLSLPGIDLNDPIKTISTSVFVLVSCMTIHIDDVSMESDETASDGTCAIDETEKSTVEVENYHARVSTSELEGWASAFMRQVLHLIDMLPEEGNGGRIGEKHEEMVLHTLLAACDMFCSALSPRLFDHVLNVLVEYVATTISGAAVKVIGSLIACFSRADPHKVLRRVAPICIARIKTEIEHGASSIRTTSTSVPRQQDTALHYYINALGGAVTVAREAALEYADELISCISLLQERCLSERGYLLAAQLLHRLLAALLAVYPAEQRLVNGDEYASEHFARNSHLYWGRTYRAEEVRISWHVPSDKELDMGLALLDKVVEAPLANLERLLDTPGSATWHNDFCRNMCVLRFAFIAIPATLRGAPPGASSADVSSGGAPLSDFGVVDLDTLPAPMSVATGPRRQDFEHAVAALADRFGRVLVRAAEVLEHSSEEHIDTLRMLVRAMRTYLLQRGFNADEYKKLMRSVSFFHNAGLLSPRQTAHPRIVWIKRALFYHVTRQRLCAQWRARTEIDDALVQHLAALSLSDYVAVRKSAQATLEPVCVHYDGTRSLILGKVLSALAPDSAEGPVKGALHILGTKGFLRATIHNASFARHIIPALLGVQHHTKPTIQKLVRGVLHDIIIRLPEPSVRHAYFKGAQLEASAAAMRELVGGTDTLYDTPARRAAASDAEHLALLAVALAAAHAPTTHWAFLLVIVRLLHAEMRRDRPVASSLALLFTKLSIADNPSLRRYAQQALTKALYLIKLRTHSTTTAALYLEQGTQPLKKCVPRTTEVTPEYAAAYTAQFKGPLETSTHLRDHGGGQWLMWGPDDQYTAVATEGNAWEEPSHAAIRAVERTADREWWNRLAGHFSHEVNREYLSLDAVQLTKSISQIIGEPVLEHVVPLVEELVAERDRHKHRAAAEIVTGLLRGAKHWQIDAANRLCEWADRLLVHVLVTCAPDSQPAWQMCIECVFRKRDPRRMQTLLGHLVDNARESLGSTQGALQQANAQFVLKCAVCSLQYKFIPWGALDFTSLYSTFLGHDYQEVRRAVVDTLIEIDFSMLRPALANVDAFLATGAACGSLLVDQSSIARRCSDITTKLHGLRAERVPVAAGTSAYDRMAMAVALWISMSLDDHRVGPMSELAISFLPDLFHMHELRDNSDLSSLARKVLVKVVSYEHSAKNANALIRRLLTIAHESSNSWRTRLDVFPFLQIAYFENLFLLSRDTIQAVLHLVLELLSDSQVEVREMAATTLSGIVRCSQRSLITSLRESFASATANTPLPKRGTPGFDAALRTLHANILGACALIDAFPYDVPDWMPELILDTVAEHADDPAPISSTIRRCAADFRRTHQDTWAEEKWKFGSRLQEVNDFALGRCDYFV